MREFRQHDHVRLYALDIADRLRAAGFSVDATTTPAGSSRSAPAATVLIPAM